MSRSHTIDPTKRSQSTRPFPNLFSRKKGQVFAESSNIEQGRRRSMSVKVPLDTRLKTCKATEKLYKTHVLATEEVITAGDELRRHEKDVAESLRRYADDHIPSTFGNQEQHDLADMMKIVANSMEALVNMRTTHNRALYEEIITPLEALAEETSIVNNLNTNQLDTETQYLLRLRDAKYVRVLTAWTKEMQTYYEQGAQVLQNVSMAVKHIESRMSEIPKRDTSKAIFGVPLETILGRYTEPGPIPLQIEHCLQYLEKEVAEPGIFRIPGHALEVDKIKKMLDNGETPDFDNMEIMNKVHSVAGAVKLFIRDLPEPLLTYAKFDSFIETAQITEKEKQFNCLKLLVETLPQTHQHLLSRLVHTFEIIINNEETNKMNAHALSVSFGMNFLRLAQENPTKLMQSTTHINKICELIINNANRLFEEWNQPPDSPKFLDVKTPLGFTRNNRLSQSAPSMTAEQKIVISPRVIQMELPEQEVFHPRASFSEESLDNNIDEKLLNKWDQMNFSRKPKRNIVVMESRESLGSWKEIQNKDKGETYYVNTETGERSNTHPTGTNNASSELSDPEIKSDDTATAEFQPAEDDELSSVASPTVLSPIVAARERKFSRFVAKKETDVDKRVFDF